MDQTGWKSKDIVTWIILIWGFSRLAQPVSAAAECPVNGSTQNADTPPWILQLGQTQP